MYCAAVGRALQPVDPAGHDGPADLHGDLALDVAQLAALGRGPAVVLGQPARPCPRPASAAGRSPSPPAGPAAASAGPARLAAPARRHRAGPGRCRGSGCRRSGPARRAPGRRRSRAPSAGRTARSSRPATARRRRARRRGRSVRRRTTAPSPYQSSGSAPGTSAAHSWARPAAASAACGSSLATIWRRRATSAGRDIARGQPGERPFVVVVRRDLLGGNGFQRRDQVDQAAGLLVVAGDRGDEERLTRPADRDVEEPELLVTDRRLGRPQRLGRAVAPAGQDVDQGLRAEQRTAQPGVRPDPDLDPRDDDQAPLAPGRALRRQQGHGVGGRSALDERVARHLLAAQVLEELGRPGLGQPVHEPGGGVEERDDRVQVAIGPRSRRAASQRRTPPGLGQPGGVPDRPEHGLGRDAGGELPRAVRGRRPGRRPRGRRRAPAPPGAPAGRPRRAASRPGPRPGSPRPGGRRRPGRHHRPRSSARSARRSRRRATASAPPIGEVSSPTARAGSSTGSSATLRSVDTFRVDTVRVASVRVGRSGRASTAESSRATSKASSSGATALSSRTGTSVAGTCTGTPAPLSTRRMVATRPEPRTMTAMSPQGSSRWRWARRRTPAM